MNCAHCRNMLRACEDGYVIIPPMLTFYNGCETTMDQVDHVVGKVLMQFGLEHERFRPWEAVSVAAGIHVDHATPEQIEELYHNCLAAADAACEAYEGNRPC